MALLLALTPATVLPTAMLLAHPERDRPVEDFIRKLVTPKQNIPLVCTASRRLNRDGDVVWLRLDCRASSER